MKTRALVLACAAMLTVLIACSNDDEANVSIGTAEIGGVVTDPTSPIAAFFATELRMPSWDGEGNKHMTFFDEGEYDSEECLLINSREEFKAAYKGTKELPDIDFGKYTLIIGRTWGEDTSVILDHFELTNLGNKYLMETFVCKVSSIGFCMITHIMYWQLYPKMPTKPVITKRTWLDARQESCTITPDNIIAANPEKGFFMLKDCKEIDEKAYNIPVQNTVTFCVGDERLFTAQLTEVYSSKNTVGLTFMHIVTDKEGTAYYQMTAPNIVYPDGAVKGQLTEEQQRGLEKLYDILSASGKVKTDIDYDFLY